MVSVLPMAAPGVDKYEDYYSFKRSVPSMGQRQHRLHRAASSAAAHMRSLSMPEAVFLQHQSLGGFASTLHGAHIHPPPPPPPEQPQSVSYLMPKPGRVFGASLGSRAFGQDLAPVASSTLRRSHTNAADFTASRSRRQQLYHQQQQQRLLHQHQHFGSSQFLAWHPTSGAESMLMPARSRTNIASLCPPQPLNAKDLMGSSHRLLTSSSHHHRSMGILLETSFTDNKSSKLTRRKSQSCRDLSKPLHVDCSVEYDLGHQPKIPKDAAPLLIIHPDYQNRHRFHPYSTPISPEGGLNPPSTPTHNSTAPSPTELTQSAPAKTTTGRLAAATMTSRGAESNTINGMLEFQQVRRHRQQQQQQQLIAQQQQLSQPKKSCNHHQQQQQPKKSFSIQYHQRQGQGRMAPNLGGGTRPRGQAKSRHQSYYDNKGLHLSMPDITEGCKARRSLGPDLGGDLNGSNKLTSVSQNLFCDSGLGTPSSLMDHDTRSSPPGSSGSNLTTGSGGSSSGGSHSSTGSKWRSSMSGLMTGFFCCSAPINEHSSHHYNVTTTANTNVIPIRVTSTMETTSPASSSGLTASRHDSPVSDLSCHKSADYDTWVIAPEPGHLPSLAGSPEMDISSPESSVRWASPPSSQAYFRPIRPTPPTYKPKGVCPNCRQDWNSDCSDGFCAALWPATASSIRPIHI